MIAASCCCRPICLDSRICLCACHAPLAEERERTALAHQVLKMLPAMWKRLQLVGVQPAGDGLHVLEMRNCYCGSTLAQEVLA